MTDNTGGVLPGVTVTVTGDAITGAPPVAFTDGQGQYSIPGLPLGTFTVTFTLPGFSTLVREGIELSAQFTANIDAVMEVGAASRRRSPSRASRPSSTCRARPGPRS